MYITHGQEVTVYVQIYTWSSFLICTERRRLDGYITNKLPNISRCIADIYTNSPWFKLFSYATCMLNFDCILMRQKPVVIVYIDLHTYTIHRCNNWLT